MSFIFRECVKCRRYLHGCLQEEEEEEEDINEEEEEEEEDINEEEARSWYKFSELWVLLRTNYHVSHGMSHGIKAFIP